MQVQLIHEGVSLSEDQKNYIFDRLKELEKFSQDLFDADSRVRVDVASDLVQFTLFVPYSVIRAEVEGEIFEQTFDAAFDQLQKKVGRYREKSSHRSSSGEWIPESTLQYLDNAQLERLPGRLRITKRKRFKDFRPMHEEEAVIQMELLGHDFFVFENKDTTFFSLLYKRSDGTVGMIEIEKIHIRQW